MLPLATNQLCHYSLKATIDIIGLANRFVQVLHTKPEQTLFGQPNIHKQMDMAEYNGTSITKTG